MIQLGLLTKLATPKNFSYISSIEETGSTFFANLLSVYRLINCSLYENAH